MAPTTVLGNSAWMEAHESRYAVVFREQGGISVPGSLELTPDRLLLSGSHAGQRIDMRISLADVIDVHVGHKPEERLNGHSTLAIERTHEPTLLIAPLGAGLLSEIADLLITLAGERAGIDRLAVVVPLNAGCRPRAEELLAKGPPVDPASFGLTSHHVYLRDDAVVFVFAGPDVGYRVRRAMRGPALWTAGLAWRDCIAGPPRVQPPGQAVPGDAVLAFSWTASPNQ